MIGLREYLAKSAGVKRPGSRGGHPWWDGKQWRYGHPAEASQVKRAPTKTYYHVAGPEWREGDPLLPWNERKSLGHNPTWKWAAHEPGSWDGDVVSLFGNDLEATSFKEEFGGTITEVRVPRNLEGFEWTHSGTGKVYKPRMDKVWEGYHAIRGAIPPHWIKRSKLNDE